MKKILVGGTIFALGLFLIVSNFPMASYNMETSPRSIDFMGGSEQKATELHETEIGNQYRQSSNPISTLSNSISNIQWELTHIALQGTISDDNVQKNITYEYFSEMPTPPQRILDMSDEKFENPTPRKLPALQSFENEIDPYNDESINIDNSLSEIKKK